MKCYGLTWHPEKPYPWWLFLSRWYSDMREEWASFGAKI
jgi:hypothetical protein